MPPPSPAGLRLTVTQGTSYPGFTVYHYQSPVMLSSLITIMITISSEK